MKKIIRKVLLPIFTSVICGFICGKLVYEIYDNKIEEEFKGEKIFLIQAGAYETYDKMINNTLVNNYVYYEDEDGFFKSIIGITEKEKNIEKIKNTYGKEVVVNEYYSKDEELNKKIKNYDEILSKLDNKNEIQKTVLDMLNLYNGKEKQTLLKISS